MFMNAEAKKIIGEFFERFSRLEFLEKAAETAVEKMSAVRLPNKIMTCGNGGSFSDSAHIVGELMKSFRLKRPVTDDKLDKEYSEHLEEAVPAICLGEMSALSTAVINDIGSEWVYAQQVYGLGYKGDILIAISTSGNAENVVKAAKVARSKGIFVIAMTGKSGGKLKDCCDLLFNVPETETYKVQELHLPIYHALCAATEANRW